MHQAVYLNRLPGHPKKTGGIPDQNYGIDQTELIEISTRIRWIANVGERL